MKICIVVGTRPEIIKMAPIVKCLQNRNIDFILIHSNQHYSPEMDQVFFDELNLPSPNFNLNVGSGHHGAQSAKIISAIEPILIEEKPDFVFVQGDTNTVFSAAITAKKLNIPVCHVEAGLRSYDKSMPEETNRILTDQISDYLFAVTEEQKQILMKESINEKDIYVVGNTITDTLLSNIDRAKEKSQILNKLKIKAKDYFLVTVHRDSNVDSQSSLQEVVNLLSDVSNKFSKKLIWPIHPRAKKNLENFSIELPSNIQTTEPLGYLDFLNLMNQAEIILTDSGGIQEEACILKVPCVTLRDSTERPETIKVGANSLVFRDKDKCISAITEFTKRNSYNWENPFGDGRVSEKILDIITKQKPKIDFERKRICVIGLGYMGLPIASILASVGHQVHGVDVQEDKLEKIKNGVTPFDEKGMSELLQKALDNGFTVSKEILDSDIYLVTVPTPVVNNKCDLSMVLQVCKSLAETASDQSVVIVESTMKPGACKNEIWPLFEEKGKSTKICHVPERAIPGNTLFELINNDRIVGGLTEDATDEAALIYGSFVQGKIYKTNAITAECSKLLENTFRDINIATANEFAEILEDYNVDPWEAIALANKHPRVNILNPGPGVGGHCIAVDPWFLVEDTQKGDLVRTARKVNETRPHTIVANTLSFLKRVEGKSIGILGIAYKKNVDDCRETPVETIVSSLIEQKQTVKICDPYISKWKFPLTSLDEVLGCDLIVLLTDHDVFSSISFEGKSVYDTRNALNPNSAKHYFH